MTDRLENVNILCVSQMDWSYDNSIRLCSYNHNVDEFSGLKKLIRENILLGGGADPLQWFVVVLCCYNRYL